MEKTDIFQEIGSRYPLALPSSYDLHQKYTVGRVLGVGGFGITYLGWDEKLNIPVAIKEFLPSGSATRSNDGKTLLPNSPNDFRFGMERFLQEAQTLAQLNHYNIVRVRDFFEENSTAYFVMDFYDGKTLDEYMKEQGGKLPENIVNSLFIPILDGLREAHHKGIVHRDIKPQNIYLARLESGGVRPILLDFGAARFAIGSRSKSISMIVTPGYAPYEQYQTRGDQGTWTDVYGVAATMYHAATSILPPPAPDRMVDDDIVPPSQLGLSDKFNNIVLNALALRPMDRIQDAAAFQDLLLGNTTPDFAPRATNTNLMGASPQNPAATRRISESLPPIQPRSSGASQAWTSAPPPPTTQQTWNTSGTSAIPEPPKKQSNSWIWGVVGVLAFVVAGAAYLVLNPDNPLFNLGSGNTARTYTEYKKLADSLYTAQKYTDALYNYNAALEKDSTSTEVKERTKKLSSYVDAMSEGTAKETDSWYAKAIEFFKKAKTLIPEAREPDQKIATNQSKLSGMISQARAFSEQFVGALNSGDASQLYNYYHDTVSYLGKTKTRQDVKTDIETAIARYSDANYEITSPIEVEPSVNEAQRYKIFYNQRFTGTGKQTGGRVTFHEKKRLTLWWKNDHFVITYETGKVDERRTAPADTSTSIFRSLQLDTTNTNQPERRFNW